METRLPFTLVVSACLNSARCRWDSQKKHYPELSIILADCFVVPVCPEMAIGLGVPRDPIRIVASCEGIRLVQPSTGIDLTERMKTFARSFLDTVGKVDGFIFKSRSPSCGVYDTDIFPETQSAYPCGTGPGVFTSEVLKRYPFISITDEIMFIDRRQNFLPQAR